MPAASFAWITDFVTNKSFSSVHELPANKITVNIGTVILQINQKKHNKKKLKALFVVSTYVYIRMEYKVIFQYYKKILHFYKD